MAFALIILGLLLLVAATRNTQDQLFTLLKSDFTGPNNFVFWVVSLLVIGAVGYIPKLKPLSTAFLVLVVLVLFLTKGNPQLAGGGFFEQFTRQIGKTTSPEASKELGKTGQPVPGGGSDLINMIPTLPMIH
jgi:hypothetical protein